jgi:hypothetical protein
MRRPTYIVSGASEWTAYNGHGWFGSTPCMWRRLSNGITTHSLRHANAQYRRLKIADRQIDVHDQHGACVLKYGKER